MIMERRLWMVAYDVSDNRRRLRLDRALQALGQRIQYSVFECHMTLVEARFHLGHLASDLDPQTDSLRAYPLCAWCEPAVKWVGEGRRTDDRTLFIL